MKQVACPIVLLLFATVEINAQVGQYFTATTEHCKSTRVFIDHRIQEYSGTDFSVSWSGSCLNGYAHGKGVLLIKGTKTDRAFTMSYEGSLAKGKKEGEGKLYFSSYDFIKSPDLREINMAPYYYYIGGFKNDEFHGRGNFRSDYPDPTKPDDMSLGVRAEKFRFDLKAWRSDLYFFQYEGNFYAGRISDATFAKGRTKRMAWVGEIVGYEGEVKNGQPNGKGNATEQTVMALMIGQNWGSAEGNFVNGYLSGYGKHVTRYSIYEGEFVNGFRQGKGKLTVYRHPKTDEEWKLGYVADYIVEGEFKAGYVEGFTTIYYQNSAAYKYTGPLKEGVPEGTGEVEFMDGAKLRGHFREGSMEGEGSIHFANGDKFIGHYVDSRPQRGTFYYRDGIKYEGGISIREEKDKVSGKIIQVYIRSGNGMITEAGGTRYSVNCVNDKCTRTD